MTSVHPASDLHLEFEAYQTAVTADIVILAGDIHVGTKGLSWARECFPDSEIIYVAGNHEYYHHQYQELLFQIRNKSKQLGIYFLEKDEVILNNLRFLGCTLWTDYRCSEHLSQEDALEMVNYRLADHRLIRFNNDVFSTRHALALHLESTAWLKQKLVNESFLHKTVVITHHGPSTHCIHKRFGAGELAGAFYSDLPELLNQVDLWIYGHTHSNLDMMIGNTRLLSNQRGYPKEGILDFRSDLLVEI
jgi:predicted phosphodiesterase